MPQPKRSLPNFAKRDYNKALRLATDILTAPHTEKTSLIQLTEFQDGHFRAVFKSNYFVIAEGQEQPSKSQWNTLKKKFKRHDRLMFVFKEHGVVSKSKNDSSINYYIDFGFFAD